MGHARALITVDKPEVQTEIFKRIISEDLSVRMVEKLVRELPSHQFHKKPEDKKSSVAGRKNIFLDTLEKKMEEKFGNRVSLSQKENGKGEIRIPFENTDDLNRILEILGI
jgi:ParB family chromosome partitioning protein